METRLYAVDDLIDHTNPGELVYRARSSLGTVGLKSLIAEIRKESKKQGFVIMNMQTTTAVRGLKLFKVLFLIDTKIDPTAYNFKDISDSEEFFTYITNDFHPEWNCNEIVKEFKKVCETAGITLLTTQLIHKDHIAKEYL